MTDHLTYAIGDIHGCSDLLESLLERIEAHSDGRPHSLVFLGDYIDRGLDSAGVLRTVRRLHWNDPERITCLIGNHESMLLAALQVPGAADLWLRNGGGTTLASFGLDAIEDVPGDVLDWIEALPSVHADAERWYVHAGFRPGCTPPDPDLKNRLWIREPFLSEDCDFGRHVVHGHTPQLSGQPELRPHRTNLDTGAVYGGALTAGVFAPGQGPAVAYLSVPARRYAA
jgi:serine/threonine protein phosphatase 1